MHHAPTLQQSPTTHERLRQTALELFSTHGYQSTSLRDLATHLGVQAGSIYNHIENKQSLLFELIEDALDDLLAETRLNLRQGATAHTRLRLFIQTFVAFQAREKQRLALLERETVNLSGEQRARITTLRQEYAQCLSSVIYPELAGGQPSRSARQILTNAIIGMLGSLSLWSEEESALPSQEVVDQLTLIIAGAIAAAKR